MNVEYRTSAATRYHTSHLQLFIISPSSFKRRTSYRFIYYYFIILFIFSSYNLCTAFENQVHQVPSNHRLLSSFYSVSLNSALNKSLNLSSYNNQSTTSFDNKNHNNNHDLFNNYKDQNIEPSTSSFSSSKNHTSSSISSYLVLDNFYDKDNLLFNSLVDSNQSTVSVNQVRKKRKELDYLVIDRNDLFKNKRHIFLNLTSINLKRDNVISKEKMNRLLLLLMMVIYCPPLAL